MAGNPLNPEIKARVLRMLGEGIHQNEVAKACGVTLRTVQRWKSESGIKRQQRTLNATPLPSPQPQLQIQNNWLYQLENTLDSHAECHRKIWQELAKMLLKSLEDDDVNSKTINTLSLALDRHLQGEIRSLAQGKQDVLTFNQAFKLLDSLGYSITPKNELGDLN